MCYLFSAPSTKSMKSMPPQSAVIPPAAAAAAVAVVGMPGTLDVSNKDAGYRSQHHAAALGCLDENDEDLYDYPDDENYHTAPMLPLLENYTPLCMTLTDITLVIK